MHKQLIVLADKEFFSFCQAFQGVLITIEHTFRLARGSVRINVLCTRPGRYGISLSRRSLDFIFHIEIFLTRKVKKLFTSVTTLLAGGIVYYKVAPQFGAAASGARLKRMGASEHFRDGRFHNLSPTPVMVDTSLQGSIKMGFDFVKGVAEREPENALPVVPLANSLFNRNPGAGPAVSWFGHSAVLLEIDGKLIFIDPMLGERASPFSFAGTRRFSDNLPADIEELPHLDAVLITHDHYDHLDYGSILKLKDKTTHFYVPLGVGAHLERWGVAHGKISELDWWDTAQIEGISLVATPARHFSGRGIGDRNKTLWCSWVIRGSKHSIYFSGDSGYDQHFKEIGDACGPFDLTMLECGQYGDGWPLIHMTPEETLQAQLDLQGKVLMPIHWGAFALALHSWRDPVMRLAKAADSENVALAVPAIGQTWHIGDALPQEKWWVAQ